MSRVILRAMFAALWLLGLLSCAPAGEPLPKNPSQAWAEAFNRGDVAAVAALYAENAYLMPPGSELVRGRAGIEASIGKDLSQGGAKVEINSLESASKGDAGYDIGTYTIKDASGAIVDVGKFVEIWQRVGGEWKIYADIFNSDNAPVAAPQPAQPPDSTTPPPPSQ